MRSESTADIADLNLAIARLNAHKPGSATLSGIMTALPAAYACGLAALAVLR